MLVDPGFMHGGFGMHAFLDAGSSEAFVDAVFPDPADQLSWMEHN